MKTLKLATEENFLNMVKGIKKTTANIISNGEQLKAFPLKQEQDKDALILPLVLNKAIRQEKK